MSHMEIKDFPWREEISFQGPVKLDRKLSWQQSKSFLDWLLHRRPGTITARGELQATISDGKLISAVFLGKVVITAADESAYSEFVSRWHTIGRDGVLFELISRARKGDMRPYETACQPTNSNTSYTAFFEIKVYTSPVNESASTPAELRSTATVELRAPSEERTEVLDAAVA